MGTLLNNIVTVKETKIQILKHNSNIYCKWRGKASNGRPLRSFSSSYIFVLVLFFTDFTLSDELEKGLLVHIYLLEILHFLYVLRY